MKKYLWIYMFLTVFYISKARDTEDNFQDDYRDYNDIVYKKYIKMDMQIKDIVEGSVKKLLPYLLKSREQINVSAICTKNLFDLLTGFRKLKSWSLNFLDAIGKPQSGFQTGNLQMFGEYEECVETTVMKNQKINFEGQYCSISIRPYLPKIKRIPGINGRLEGLVNATRNTSDAMKFIISRAQMFYAFDIKLGICVPSGCTKEDVSQIIKYSLQDFVNVRITHCLKKDDTFYWTKTRIAFISIFIILGMTVVVSSLLDSILQPWKNKELGLKARILQSFSLKQNFPKLMNTDVSANSVTCLHGIRVLTISWIILAHEYLLYAIFLTTNHALNYQKMLPNFFSQIVLNAFVSVDIFFFMSGFVNCYTRMLIKQKGQTQPGILKMIVHRLWRIYPAYIAAFFLFHLLTTPHGNNYKSQNALLQYCDVNWWQNFLFINNFFDIYKVCMVHTWYLSADMQFFLLSLITVPILLRNPKNGVIFHVGIILIVNLFSMSFWLVDRNLPPSTLDGTKLDPRMSDVQVEIFSETMKSYKIYVLPVVHLGSYFIGILLGYVIATKKDIKIPKVTQLFGWLAASLCFVSMIFMTLRWNSGNQYTQVESSMYGAWSRTIMVLGFSWLILCCETGHARFINYILSLKLWIPLSRITYMVYLVSFPVQIHYRFRQNFPMDFSKINITWTYFADISISILMSFALTLIVESPAKAIEKILFRRNENKNEYANEVPKEMASNNGKENGFEENGRATTINL